MFGIIGSLLIILQMALLSFDFPKDYVLTVSLLACSSWTIHSLQHKDNSLLFTNFVVMGFSTWGLLSWQN